MKRKTKPPIGRREPYASHRRRKGEALKGVTMDHDKELKAMEGAPFDKMIADRYTAQQKLIIINAVRSHGANTHKIVDELKHLGVIAESTYWKDVRCHEAVQAAMAGSPKEPATDKLPTDCEAAKVEQITRDGLIWSATELTKPNYSWADWADWAVDAIDFIDRQTGDSDALRRRMHCYGESAKRLRRQVNYLKGDNRSLEEKLTQAEAALKERDEVVDRQAKEFRELVAANPDCCWRMCWQCGKTQIHREAVTPGVLCRFCGSQDTRLLETETKAMKG